jgi:hypothetical protein
MGVGASGAIQTASDNIRSSINPVDIMPAVYTGLIVGVIIFCISLYINNSDTKSNNLDINGCIIDNSTSQNSTTMTTSSTTVCRKPMSAFTNFGFSVLVGGICGLASGSIVYRISFAKANPKVSAGLFATNIFMGR